MQSNTDQEPQTTTKQKHLIRWLKNFLFFILGMIVFISAVVVAGGMYLAFEPVNITPFVKSWLPLPIIKGKDKHYPAGTLNFEKLVIAWPVWKQGFSAPLQIEIKKAEILDHQEQVQGSIQYAKLGLAIAPLFRYEIEPLSLRVDGAELRFKRTSDQRIQLDLIDQKKSSSKSKFHFNLRYLHEITIRNSHAKLTDETNNKVIQLKHIDMNIAPFYIQNTLGIVGHVMAQLDVDGHLIQLSAQSGADENIEIARQMLDKTGLLKWHIQMDGFNPADFARVNPSLKALAPIDLPVSLTADIGLKSEPKQAVIEPYETALTIKTGQGRVAVKGQDLYPSSLDAHLHADFSTDLQKPIHVTMDKMVLQLRSPTALDQNQSGPLFQFTGSLFLSSLLKTKEVKLNFVANSSTLDFATIKNYWPATVAKGAHAWVTENITSGQVHGFNIEVGLASQKGWEHLDLVHLGGGIKEADHAEIYWLRPVPPLKDMKASLRFVDPSRIYIKLWGGYQVVYPNNKPTDNYRTLSVPKGDMWITGLDNHEETGIISTDIQGKLKDIIALLSEPRLRLLSRHPLPFKHPSGDVKTTLKVKLPLKKKVKIEQIDIQGHNEIQNAYLDNVALDKDFKDGSLTINVDTNHLELTGKGIFSVFPVTLKYMQKFSHKNEQSIIETAQVRLDITPDSLKKMQVDTSGDFVGDIPLFVGYEKLHNGQATVNLRFDLSNAGIQLPIWTKNIGQPATFAGDVVLDQGKLIGIRNLYAQGKDLSLDANVSVVNHTPQQLNITSFQIGRSVGQASLNIPMTKEAINNPQKGDIRLSVKADALDAVPFVNKYIGKDKKKTKAKKTKDQYQLPIAATGRYSGPRGRKWIVNIQAQKIYYRQDQFLGNVTTYMEYNGVRLMRLSFGMRKPFVMTASLFPKNHYRYFHLEAQDFGSILETVGVSTQLKGGSVVFKGRFDDAKPSAPFNGQINIKNVTLENAPLAMRRLSDASIYGLFKKRKNKEIILDTIQTNLSLSDGILSITDGLVHNEELGATLQGNVNLNQANLDVRGTIVPLYAINKLFGFLPAVGKLFSPEKGGGFVAIPFDIEGSFKKPIFDIYPSRILTPGALRELFY
ncbi:YhdP family protein [Commensalibacter nepenthis]|uniref:AsmA-like C-terminal region-containing protein n=1 Tax=Commensalibacter nepenthis TaxID=3043872 RepID=A0ABT6Q6D4_9PROT|nr:AsmA-like C-terminal region-containing protein [Commensalibacter sp. TBRC 10068]MDI2112450.1 AsmA-like C-terminal region-containing protein [Commensalibacter sp. TBRC 10068]